MFRRVITQKCFPAVRPQCLFNNWSSFDEGGTNESAESVTAHSQGLHAGPRSLWPFEAAEAVSRQGSGVRGLPFARSPDQFTRFRFVRFKPLNGNAGIVNAKNRRGNAAKGPFDQTCAND